MPDLISSEVLCDIGQLYDLTNRPDVERYGWDGANVEFDVTIMWEYETIMRERRQCCVWWICSFYLPVGTSDRFWLFIFTLNRAKKWFNSKNYSIQNWTKIFIQRIIQIGKIISAWKNREKHAKWAVFSSKWAVFSPKCTFYSFLSDPGQPGVR